MPSSMTGPVPATKSRSNLSRTNNSKPQLHRRLTPTKPNSAHRIHSRQGSTHSFPADDDDFDGISFQQYCSVCDKIVPSTSTLYCSDVCRQKDTHSSNSMPLFRQDISPSISPVTGTTAAQDMSNIRDIIPQRSPTIYRNPSVSYYEHQRQLSDADQSGDDARSYMANSYTESSFSPLPPPLASPSTPAVRRPNPRWSSTSFSAKSVDLVTPISMSEYNASIAASAASSLATVTDLPSHQYSLPASANNGAGSTKRVKSPEEKLSYERKTTLGSMQNGRGTLKDMFREKGNGPVGTPGPRKSS